MRHQASRTVEIAVALRRLAGAVLLVAIQDARRGDETAWEWLMWDSKLFVHWCHILNLDPEIYREKILRYLIRENRHHRRIFGKH